ncbi:MAG TPA: formyltransferase family protein [Thermoanaerobaculia bacterium]|nr:formyltransferase family protein [Thermoanaerobaculia bacterium]
MIVVLTNGNHFARILLEQLVAERAGEIAKIILITGDYKGRTGFGALRWLAGVTTWPYLVYKVATVLVARRGVADLARQYDIPIERHASVKELASLDAELVVSVSCPQIIPSRLLKNGGINIHSSLLPRYGGLAPYYWVLADGESRTGTTVHVMTQKVDEGNILGVAEVGIEKNDSAFALFTRLARAGAPLLADAVTRALRGDPGTPMSGERTYRSHPDFASYRRLRRNGHRLVRLRELVRAACETLPPRR